jgi:hypothetical protein
MFLLLRLTILENERRHKSVSAQINDKTLNEELFALYDNTKKISEKTDGMDAVYDYLGISRDKKALIRL